ncbi:beta-galactosidase [Haloferula luteola]|uniref:Beta-galactosidase n=1 Tax=Haloferula luteola TaxID=595692 RepID=A0A840V467_9BACT|nr:DUF4982 domain-containing protein [Haloferula luteola]MBB5353087.1 beta-galactosidase [Haloferula luteola]
MFWISRLLWRVCWLCWLLVWWLPSAAHAQREVLRFNQHWRLHVGICEGAELPSFPDGEWEPVTLPRAWNEDDAFRVDIADLPTGTAWYRKTFALPERKLDERVVVVFEGVRHGAEFYINGQSLGFHEDGITEVGFDLTPHLNPPSEPNVLAVRTNNAWDYREQGTRQRYQWNDRNFNANYGGIPKNVWLHRMGSLHQTLPVFPGLGTSGTYIYADEFELEHGRARVHAESEVKNDSERVRSFRYEVVVAELDGTERGRFSGVESITLEPGESGMVRASGGVDGLQWWSWGYGYLYDVKTRLLEEGEVVDEMVTRTGFRQVTFGDGQVALNGRVIQLKGYAQRTTNEWPALGSAVPAWLSDFSNGMMVESGANLVRWMHTCPWRQDIASCDRVGLLQAMPAGDAEKDVTGRRWEQRVEVMTASIIAHRNHPSVVFYEGGNHGISEAHMAELLAIRDRWDPHGGRAIGARDMLASGTAEYGGEMLYINKSARNPFWAMEYSRDEGLRRYWDEFSPPYHPEGEGRPYKGEPAPAYHHNQDQHAMENVRRWYDYWECRPGTGSRVSSGGVNIVFSDTNTHHRGEVNYRTSGEVDAMRLPKDGFFAHQVMWDGWVDVEHPRAHLLGHWNYKEGIKKPVVVVSSAREVALFLDGQSLGRCRTPEKRFLFSFPEIPWRPGRLVAVGYDEEGREVCRDQRETTGPAVALRLTSHVSPDGVGFKADGADVALVDVEVVDAQGRRVPTAMHPITFELTGPAEWRGGIAVGPENSILAKTLPVECGVNRVLLRSHPEAGSIRLIARAPGLASATLELESQVPPDAAAALVPRPWLTRGPTPKGPSFQPHRISVPVASIRAGGRQQEASWACDDNEETAWENGGDDGSAWVEFTLARPAVVDEITAKFPGWRSRTYPLAIFVDGREVYRGTTSTSLGYVTLPLRPQEGRVVRVQCVGKGEVKEGFGGIREVEDAGNASDGPPVAPGRLGIVEIEFHERVR